MPTSTIFRNIVLKSEEDVTSFLDAIEQSQQDATLETSVDVEFIENEQTLNAFLNRIMNANG